MWVVMRKHKHLGFNVGRESKIDFMGKISLHKEEILYLNS